MKILLFTLEYPPFNGGVANYCGNLIKYWPEQDSISTLDNSGGRLINNKLPILKWIPACLALREKIKQNKIDHILTGNILPLGYASLICSILYKIKYSVILHGLDLSLAIANSRKKFFSEKILLNADKIICANRYVAEIACKNFPAIRGKIIIANPGVEAIKTNNAQNIEKLKEKYFLKDKIILLSVGRIVKRKGFDSIIEAMPKVLEKIPNLVYVILGNGSELKNCESLISNLGLSGDVKIIKNADDIERDCWYGACDIFIMISKNINGDFEGFGIVYLEANSAGKPVIAGDSGGVNDAVINGLNGILIDPENSNQIISAIIKLARDQSLRKLLGERGKKRAIDEFNWKKQINKIYKAII